LCQLFLVFNCFPVAVLPIGTRSSAIIGQPGEPSGSQVHSADRQHTLEKARYQPANSIHTTPSRDLRLEDQLAKGLFILSKILPQNAPKRLGLLRAQVDALKVR
jgi:hypothetical protein